MLRTKASINAIQHGSLWSAVWVLAFLVFSAFSAHAQFSLGAAANYAVLYEGTGGNQLMINNGPGPNGLAVVGNIGIGGTGQLQLSGPLVINGNVNFSGSVSDNGPYSGNIAVNGSISGNDSTVSSALSTVNSLYSELSGETGTTLNVNLSGTGGSQTINASSGTLDSMGNEVFSVNSFTFNNGNTLTINGSASQYVVINFSGGAQFGGTILLTGGITSDHVLFNIGGTLQINSNGATETGTFLDPDGTMSINHSILDGQFFGGDDSNMSIVSGGEVDFPTAPVPEPTTILSAVLLLVPLSVGTLRMIMRNRAGKAAGAP